MAARYHYDKHVVKMVLESAQLLSSAHHALGGQTTGLYKPTHLNHPCALWVRESGAHYAWLYKHHLALCAEYTYRYNRVHKTQYSGVSVLLGTFPQDIPGTNGAVPFWTDPPAVVPVDETVDWPGDSVDQYRHCYVTAKLSLAAYTRRHPPQWLLDEIRSLSMDITEVWRAAAASDV